MSHLNAAANKSAFLVETCHLALFNSGKQVLTDTILSAIQNRLVTTHHLAQFLQTTDQPQPDSCSSTLRSNHNIFDMSRNTARMDMFAFNEQCRSSYKFV